MQKRKANILLTFDHRVYLKSPILEQDVIIADVPGGSDVNYFRTTNASQYLQKCDMTIVVAKIDRVADDPSFRSLYLEAYRRRRSGSVILVATKSDVGTPFGQIRFIELT